MLEFLLVLRGGDESEYVTGLDERESTRYDYPFSPTQQGDERKFRQAEFTDLVKADSRVLWSHRKLDISRARPRLICASFEAFEESIVLVRELFEGPEHLRPSEHSHDLAWFVWVQDRNLEDVSSSEPPEGLP